MSRYCVVRTCKEQAGESVLKGEKTRCHKFPRDESLKAQWELFVNQANHTTDFKATSHTLCSRHFESSCYLETGRLQGGALPTLADKFTLKTAFKYRLLPPRTVTYNDLAKINDFSNTVVTLRNPSQDDPDDLQLHIPAALEIQGASSSGCCDHDDVLIGCDDDPLGEIQRSHTHASSSQMSKGCSQPILSLEVYNNIYNNPCERSSKSTPIREKRKYFPGDLTPSDFESPHQRVHNLILIKRELHETKYHLKLIRQKYKRAMNRINVLEQLVSRLTKKRGHSQQLELSKKLKNSKSK